jgi:hypothetical protein
VGEGAAELAGAEDDDVDDVAHRSAYCTDMAAVRRSRECVDRSTFVDERANDERQI